MTARALPPAALLQQVYDLCDEDTWEGENGSVLARQVRDLITSQTAVRSAGEQFLAEIVPAHGACPGCVGGFGYADNAHTRDERCGFRDASQDEQTYASVTETATSAYSGESS